VPDDIAQAPPGEIRRPVDREPVPPSGPPAGAPKPPHRRRALYWTGGILALLAAAVAAFLLIFDWNMLRGPIGRYASARLHREVAITGDLNAHIWSWTPSATARGIRIGNPPWAQKKPMATIDRLAVQIRLLPLLRGHVDLMLVEADKPRADLLRDRRGRATWDFSDGRKPGAAMRLPPIRKFVIDDGKLRIVDQKRGLIFNGTIDASEKLGAANRGFQLRGDGSLNRAPFRLEVTGGPLLNIDRDRPYPFAAEVRAGATFITAKGQVTRPFDLGHLAMNATARGQDLADLYELTGVTLPNTPPYRLSAHFTRDGTLYRFAGLSGRVGDSDLAGRMAVDVAGGRPKLNATLATRSLDFDDLAAVFGGAPKRGAGETASPQQVATGQAMAAQRRLFPDATLKVDRLRAMDARVDYRAHAVRDAPIPLRSGSVKLVLDHGLLTADPVAFELPQGRIAGAVKLNARSATPVTDLDLRLSNARLEQLVPVRGGERPLSGALVGRIKLHGAGDSVHRAAANASGQVTVVAPGGEIRKAFAELMGVNVIKGLGLLWLKDQSATPIRCAVADFHALNGVLVADTMVLDTGPVVAKGSGTINLGAERVDLRLKGHPKKFRIGRLSMPITVKGPLAAPKVGVEPDGAVAQGGAALALGGLLSPLAAILPFVDPGLAKNAPCGALVAEAGHRGAPVKVAGR
jgi:uncharacterized protein involved in outer membrane biogenesis